MKKALAWICVVAGLVLLASSSSWFVISRILKWNNAHLTGNVWFAKYSSPWGDLVKMSLLDKISKYHEPVSYAFVKPADDGNKNIDLYLLGDSHTEDVPSYAFANVSSYHYGRTIAYELNPAKKNILILEVNERLVLGSYCGNEIYDALRVKDEQHPIKALWASDEKKGYSRVVNKNLDYLLFDYRLINAIRREKADMNYYWFGRASGDVTVSDNGQYLFFTPTLLPYGVYSSDAPVDDNTINELVTNLNQIYDHYKKEGFSAVYFSIIPNPVTILQPNGYNNLIPRVKNNPSLRMPYLDIYDTFKKCENPSMLYRVGDTHWNNNGMQLWLNVVNTELRKKSMGN